MIAITRLRSLLRAPAATFLPGESTIRYRQERASGALPVSSLREKSLTSSSFPGGAKETLGAIDWFKRGMATDARNQMNFNPSIYDQITFLLGHCYAIAHGKSMSFSSRHLTDAIPWSGHGCLVERIFTYCMLHGVYTEQEYMEQMLSTLKQEQRPAFKITGFRQTRPHDLKELLRALKYQPLLIGVRTNSTFFNYKGGFFTKEYVPDVEENNGPKKPDHYLIVMGNGEEIGTGQQFLQIRNCLGTSWGYGGYMFVSTKVLESWGMLDGAWYPIIGSDRMGEVYRKACIGPDGRHVYYYAPEMKTGH